MAAITADMSRHILDHTDDRHRHLLKHLDCTARINEGNVLRRGHDDCARQTGSLRSVS